MTELEVLQQISRGVEFFIGMCGVFIGLLLALIFALAWGRNTHV